jgi:outer membrane receptor protein involved in Fe transport
VPMRIRVSRRSARSGWLLPLLLVPLLLFPLSASAQMGRLTGVVVDEDNGDVLPFANVVLVGTRWGAMALDDGTFRMISIPPGTYQVRAMMMGYQPETIEGVEVKAGETVELRFELERTLVKTEKEVVVEAEPLVNIELAQTVRTVDAEEISAMPVETVSEVIEKQAGIQVFDDQVFIRGGRADETVFVVDGVMIRDAISGESKLSDISARSVAEMDIITGGFDAEYGQALSGVVNIRTKEGSDEHHGYFGWTTDELNPENSFGYNTSNLQLEGPLGGESASLPLFHAIPGKLNYFLDVVATATDTHLPGSSSKPGVESLNSSYTDVFLGKHFEYGDFFTPRLDNLWQALFKLNWRLSARRKFTFTLNKILSVDHGFFYKDIGSREQAFATNYYYEWSRRLDHYLTYTDDKNTLSLNWTEYLNPELYFTLRLSRFFNNQHRDVAGEPWFDYERPDDLALPPSQDHPYFVDSGDYNEWHDRYIETYTLDYDLVKKFGEDYRIKAGLEENAQSIQYISIRDPWVEDPDNLGGEHDLYHVHPHTGSAYVQGEFKFQGLIGKAGVRWDYWFPGEEVEMALDDPSLPAVTPELRHRFYQDTYGVFGHRFKSRISPRFAVSHPISEGTNFFFNYGRFSQWPSYYYVYSKLTSVSSEEFPRVGNPNLDPEVSTQFEVGLQHTFHPDLAAKVTLFNKDIYDYPTSTRVRQLGQGDYFIYLNNDYARTRGFELEVRQRAQPYLSGRASYTYSVAVGKKSDPNETIELQELGGSAAEEGLGEVFMWWNRPHKFSLSLDFRVREGVEAPSLFGRRLFGDWGLNLYWSAESGRAYTPEDADGNEIGKKYSKNAPVDQTVDLKFTKGLRVFGTRLEFQMDIRNLFDERIPRRIDPQSGEPYEDGKGVYSDPPSSRSSSEFRQASLADPSQWGPPRQIRIGLGVDW